MTVSRKDDVPTLHGAPGTIVNTVTLSIAAVTHLASFNFLGFELLGAYLDVYKSTGADYSKEPQARFHPMQRLLRGLHSNHEVRCLVAQKRGREH